MAAKTAPELVSPPKTTGREQQQSCSRRLLLSVFLISTAAGDALGESVRRQVCTGPQNAHAGSAEVGQGRARRAGAAAATTCTATRFSARPRGQTPAACRPRSTAQRAPTQCCSCRFHNAHHYQVSIYSTASDTTSHPASSQVVFPSSLTHISGSQGASLSAFFPSSFQASSFKCKKFPFSITTLLLLGNQISPQVRSTTRSVLCIMVQIISSRPLLHEGLHQQPAGHR